LRLINAVDVQKTKSWGTIVDPDKDCKIQAEEDTLTITVPSTAHDLGVEHDLMNAPRVLRKVSGDFTAQVLVSGSVAAEGPGTLTDRLPFKGAGLLLLQDENNYIRLERASYLDPMGNSFHYASFELRKNGKIDRFALPTDLPLADKDTYLRLERSGDKIDAAASEDGKKWRSLKAMTVEFPRNLQIGVTAVNTSSKVFEIRFKDLKVTQKSDKSEETKKK
jgi:regulation of enolase protein 1 (concanavalin A-like superfamily)